MSSMRRQQLLKTKRTLKPKRTAPKKDWVSTVHDLSVHKLTPAQLSHRHEMMKSHNKVAAQWELREKALKQRLRHGSPSPLDDTSLSIVREVLSDQMLLQDVLARSDRALSVVKDIFGDAPRRQTGHPSVTKAPTYKPGSVLPVFQRPDPPTELSLLSQSMMDSQALNELEYSDEDGCDENSPSHLNVDVVQRGNIRKMKSGPGGKVVRKKLTNRVPATPNAAGSASDPAALNATVAVQRVRRSNNHIVESDEGDIVPQLLNPERHSDHSGSFSCSVRKTKKCADRSRELDGSSFASLSGDQSSLGLLQSMLEQVEAELDFFTSDSEPTSDQNPHPHRTKGLTGFSVALVSTLGRLVHLFKQANLESQKATLERKQLEEELKKKGELIQVLTAQNTALRKETAALEARIQQKISEIEEKVDTVVIVMGGTEIPCVPPPETVIPAAAMSRVVAEKDHGPTPVSPVVQLSPPQQRDPWPQHRATHPVRADLVPSPANISSFVSNTSLLSPSSVSLSSLSSKLSAEAMMLEIAELSRQNELIKAQLNQTRSSALGGTASPNNSFIEERRLSCGSRDSPQSSVERSTSRSSRTKSVEPPGSEQGETSLLNTSSVEQRLLELNRQSAAARARLLEIIDQQKQIVSTKQSPSVSPVPHTAVNPVSDRRASPDVSQIQKEQATFSEFSQSLKGKASDKAAKEKQTASEGWFSLSTHLR